MGGKRSVLKLILLCTTLIGSVHAQTIGYGDQIIPDPKDSKTSCAAAEVKAISNAIEQKYGFVLQHEQFKVCKENCNYDSVSRTEVLGRVHSILERHSYIHDKVCYSTVKVLLKEESFLNASVVGSDVHTSGTPIHYEVMVSEKLFMYVFAKAGSEFDMLFPVSYYDDVAVSGKFTYPSYPVEIIPELSDNKNESREELIFLFTRFPLGFDRRRFTYNQLEELTGAIPNKSKRIIRRSTHIVR